MAKTLGISQPSYEWMKIVAEVNLRYGTIKTYRILSNTHIIPRLGHLPLDKLTSRVLQSYFSDKQKEGLSSSTVSLLRALLSNILKSAIKQKIIKTNPLLMIEIVKQRKEKRMLSLSEDETQIILKSCENVIRQII